MGVNSIGGKSTLAVQSLVEMRARLDDLQRQLSSGKKSDTYSGIGLDRGLTVGLRAQLSATSSYASAITNTTTRISLVQSALSRIGAVGNETKSAVLKSVYDPDGNGQSTIQKTAMVQLDEMLGLLNTRAGDRYLFSGRSTDKPAAANIGQILNGEGSKAGLKQLIAERNQADLGADGLGRLEISSPSATSVAIEEDAVSPFGFKLASASSTLTGATVTGPTGTPAGLSIDLGVTNPNEGETFTVRFTLPDGSNESITLTATAASPAGAGQFSIGATSADTAANLNAALTTSIGKLASTALSAASAMEASNAFFDADADNPPMRVDGPPFNTATGMVAGTASNTVIWYTGEAGSDSARSTATSRIDQSISVSYGARANEEGIRWIVQNVAVLAATTYSPSEPDGAGRAAALNTRLSYALDTPPDVQTVQNIATEFAAAQISLKAASTRHQQTSATLGDFLQQIEGVSNEEVGVQLLALQTRLQASMQTTAMLYQTSLVNYI